MTTRKTKPRLNEAEIDLNQLEHLSIREIYAKQCKQYGCNCNSLLLKQLPTDPGMFDQTEIDLSGNMVGPKGLLPVLELVRINPRLRRLIVKDNYLDNNAIHQIVVALRGHPSVTFLDVSSNPISWTAGMSLLELVTQNPKVRGIDMTDTHIKPSIIDTILKRIDQNQFEQREKDQRPKATSSSMVARLRALKRLFEGISVREDNPQAKIHKRNIMLGYKENIKLQTGEDDCWRTPEFWHELQQRCNADQYGLIDWETFLLISMCDDVSYDGRDVERLKREFMHWDKDNNGHIDLLELKEMMLHLNGGIAPTNQEVAEKLQMYDADDSNTITWDEFCLMMYEWLQGAPALGSFSRAPATPQPIQRKAPHW
eukprot:TRINITY_DN48430_c0_g1_i1.p1 TRINITY_DN48430_c0_g1~~TRINITY_DN48430_c0_g1_i1.p1  ORF type:complete len:370 (-),score=9.14 TRINITY_DN48430_c0_g1_i1:130-1239(-)